MQKLYEAVRDSNVIRFVDMMDGAYWDNACVPIYNDSRFATHIAFFSRDVSDLMETKEKLHKARAEIAEVYDNVPVGIFKVTRAGRYITANNEMARILGYGSPDELIENVTDIGKQIYVNPADRERMWTILSEFERIDNYEVLNRRKDGTHIWTLRSYKAIRNSIGDTVFADGYLVDISEKKELEKLREDIDKILRHDLRSPLNGIAGLTGLLLTEDSLSSSQRESLGLIENEAKRMNHMINTSLVIHQIEIGSYVQNGMLLDVTKPISYVVRELLPTCTAKGVTVEFYVQGEMYTDKLYVFLCADEYLFASVIENLLKNAVEASPSGKQVVVSVYYEDRFFYIKIENYGVVPESIRHIFFNKYVTCNKYGGTGIGTYSAKLMAEAMGGDVELDTSIEEKTIITVWLPKPNLDM